MPKKTLLYYSVNTKLAKFINEQYYDDVHYLWVSPYYNNDAPDSSNPKKIEEYLRSSVRTNYHVCHTIEGKIEGLRRGVKEKYKSKIITQNQKITIEKMIDSDRYFTYFTPLIYNTCKFSFKQNYRGIT